MIKYIAYLRKSTDNKERQILSIETQLAELKEFTAKEDLHIVEYISESKTAKEPGRKKFQELLKTIESGKANGIISWHPDRLARNSVDGGKIIYLLDTGKLKSLKFPTFWFENTPQGKFMLSIAFGQSKYYVDNLSENVKRGFRQKLRRGELPGTPPRGYKNNLVNKTIIVDKKKAKYIKKAFELFSTGGYTFTDTSKILYKVGITGRNNKPITCTRVKRMLSNPFYYGIIRFRDELYEGKHIPLISKKLFDRVQIVINQKGRKQKVNKHNFHFLGLAKCGECGASITAEKHTKYYKRTNRIVKYTYYRCSKKIDACSQKYISDDSLEQQIRSFVAKVSLNDYVVKKFLEWAEKDAQKDKLKNASVINGFQTKLHAIEQKLDKLLEGYLDNLISKADYKKKKNELMESKTLLNNKIHDLQTKGNEWLEPFEEFLKLALRARKIARKKRNSPDLLIGAKTAGSNFFLHNRQLKFSFKNACWQALAANGGAACADFSSVGRG